MLISLKTADSLNGKTRLLTTASHPVFPRIVKLFRHSRIFFNFSLKGQKEGTLIFVDLLFTPYSVSLLGRLEYPLFQILFFLGINIVNVKGTSLFSFFSAVSDYEGNEESASF